MLAGVASATNVGAPLQPPRGHFGDHAAGAAPAARAARVGHPVDVLRVCDDRSRHVLVRGHDRRAAVAAADAAPLDRAGAGLVGRGPVDVPPRDHEPLGPAWHRGELDNPPRAVARHAGAARPGAGAARPGGRRGAGAAPRRLTDGRPRPARRRRRDRQHRRGSPGEARRARRTGTQEHWRSLLPIVDGQALQAAARCVEVERADQGRPRVIDETADGEARPPALPSQGGRATLGYLTNVTGPRHDALCPLAARHVRTDDGTTARSESWTTQPCVRSVLFRAAGQPPILGFIGWSDLGRLAPRKP